MPLDSFAATNNPPTRQSPSTPSRLMSTPLIRESPMLDRAVGALLARHPGAAGQTVLASSQTQPSCQPCQVPWQLCDIGHVSCWAVAQQQMARSGGGQLIPGLNYQRLEEDWGKLETQSDTSEYDSDPDMNESIKAWMKKSEDSLDWHYCNLSE